MRVTSDQVLLDEQNSVWDHAPMKVCDGCSVCCVFLDLEYDLNDSEPIEATGRFRELEATKGDSPNLINF